jgi:hypothetical protein
MKVSDKVDGILFFVYPIELDAVLMIDNPQDFNLLF